MQKLGSDARCLELGLPALGSFLWSDQAMPDLLGAEGSEWQEASRASERGSEEGGKKLLASSLLRYSLPCEISNHDLLDAIRALAFSTDSHSRRLVDYKNLGSEELGSVYESLLELHPILNVDAGAFELKTAGGHERKRLAAIRTGDDEPSPDATRTALRDVIGHCIYGVDLNPMAVELCKVSLWMEALESGKPLSFLDHRIQCGNSLLGATPALLQKGIPDEALDPIEGDDKEVCRKFKKLNREERKGQGSLFDASLQPWERLGDLAAGLLSLEEISDDTITGVRHKQKRYEDLVRSSGYLYGRLWADAWYAAFVWKKIKEFPYPITEEVFRRIEQTPFSISSWMRDEIQRLAQQYQFFHWHLAFPAVFRVPTDSEQLEGEQVGWSDGFDVVLGNPPWERVKLQEKEWFATRRPDIANAANAATRRRMIAVLKTEDPALYRAFLEDRRQAEGESHLIRTSGRCPLCGRGDISTYAVFAETNRLILGPTGRVGCIVPSAIATDDTTKLFFRDLTESRSLVSLYSFFEIRRIFLDTDSRNSFCLITLAGSARSATQGADFVFFADTINDLHEQERHFTLTAEDIALLNPNTHTCPIFRRKRDAALTKAIYRRVPVLIKEDPPEENPWGISFMAMLRRTIHTCSARTSS